MSLEENIRFRREVRAGDEIDVTCSFIFGDGKTYRVEQELRRTDGVLLADVTNGRRSARSHRSAAWYPIPPSAGENSPQRPARSAFDWPATTS